MDSVESVVRLLNRLDSWVAGYYRISIDKAADKMADGYRSSIKSGMSAGGAPMTPLKASTLKAPIRRGLARGEGNQTVRGSVGATPMSATGETAASIQATKVGKDEWQIASSTDIGDAILKSNAKSTHTGDPFQGDTPKVMRDPLTVENKQMDIIENEIVDAIERLLQ